MVKTMIRVALGKFVANMAICVAVMGMVACEWLCWE